MLPTDFRLFSLLCTTVFTSVMYQKVCENVSSIKIDIPLKPSEIQVGLFFTITLLKRSKCCERVLLRICFENFDDETNINT